MTSIAPRAVLRASFDDRWTFNCGRDLADPGKKARLADLEA
jgi:hypothetical protein